MSNHSPMPKDDAVAYYRIASDKFGELYALFDAISKALPEHDKARKLATLGKDVAQDYENQADCWREQLQHGGCKP